MKSIVWLYYKVMMHLDGEYSDDRQRDMYKELEKVCSLFKDGYDRARALEIEFDWNMIDAKLVWILHEE